jgi:hypothetical protein
MCDDPNRIPDENDDDAYRYGSGSPLPPPYCVPRCKSVNGFIYEIKPEEVLPKDGREYGWFEGPGVYYTRITFTRNEEVILAQAPAVFWVENPKMSAWVCGYMVPWVDMSEMAVSDYDRQITIPELIYAKKDLQKQRIR